MSDQRKGVDLSRLEVASLYIKLALGHAELAKPKRRCAGYPRESKSPQRRCPSCGRFLKWDDYFGRYVDHVAWDDYLGGWEGTCL